VGTNHGCKLINPGVKSSILPQEHIKGQKKKVKKKVARHARSVLAHELPLLKLEEKILTFI